MAEPVDAPLYRWPQAARVGRVVPKIKFYEHATVSTAVREKFVTEVRRIIWTYKLAENTINLAATTSVNEIQIFELEAKGDDVSESVLTMIDRAVKMPVIFEVIRVQGPERSIYMTAALKHLNSNGSNLGVYYKTRWQPDNADRRQLPTAIDLGALYTALLEPLTPLLVRPGEQVEDMAARLEMLHKLQRQVSALERRIRAEPQFNRKVELRRTLRRKQAQLEQQR